jgi:hypothetical protein
MYRGLPCSKAMLGSSKLVTCGTSNTFETFSSYGLFPMMADPTRYAHVQILEIVTL